MDINDNDFAIIFSPEKDAKGKWEGNCLVRSVFNANTWDKKDALLMMEMITLLTSCIPLLEQDELNAIFEYDGKEEIEVAFTPIVKVEDNVIHVDMRKGK